MKILLPPMQWGTFSFRHSAEVAINPISSSSVIDKTLVLHVFVPDEKFVIDEFLRSKKLMSLYSPWILRAS